MCGKQYDDENWGSPIKIHGPMYGNVRQSRTLVMNVKALLATIY